MLSLGRVTDVRARKPVGARTRTVIVTEQIYWITSESVLGLLGINQQFQDSVWRDFKGCKEQ